MTKTNQEIILKCKEYLKLEEQLWGKNSFWHDNEKYWIAGKGTTKAGLKKRREIEREQDKILEEIGVRRITGEIDLTFYEIEDLIEILKKLEVVK